MAKTVMKVYLDLSYHSYADQKSIQRVKQCLYEDIKTLLNNDELWSCISFEIDPNADEDDVVEFLKHEEEEYTSFAPEEIED